jgi:hypothetical protein
MKYQTVAHHWFDAIRNNRVLFDRHLTDFEGMAASFQAALPVLVQLPVYVVREPVNEVFDEALTDLAFEWITDGRIKLPHPSMIWQFTATDTNRPGHADIPASDVFIVLAIDEPDYDTILFHHFVTTEELKGGWIHVPCVTRIKDGRLSAMRHQMAGESSDTPPNYEKAEAQNAIDATYWVCSSIIMMESPSIEIEAVKIPKQVNRGRSLIKKSRIPDHTVIRLPKIVYTSTNGHQGGTHKRPRPHWRRPHTRHLKSGKTADIPLMLIASREGEPPPPPPVVELVTRKESAR